MLQSLVEFVYLFSLHIDFRLKVHRFHVRNFDSLAWGLQHDITDGQIFSRLLKRENGLIENYTLAPNLPPYLNKISILFVDNHLMRVSDGQTWPIWEGQTLGWKCLNISQGSQLCGVSDLSEGRYIILRSQNEISNLEQKSDKITWFLVTRCSVIWIKPWVYPRWQTPFDHFPLSSWLGCSPRNRRVKRRVDHQERPPLLQMRRQRR